MRINQNISALNAWKNLSTTDMKMGKSLEKLSSGYRISKAADDAAGLAISEKMRGQIRGLQVAQRNAQDAISLIQTAEGAMNETHGILQRIRELAVQSASDGVTDADRAELQKEVEQLVLEVDRIGNTTEFNTLKLLDGSRGVTVTAATGAKVSGLQATGDTKAGSYTLASTTLASAASVTSADGSGMDLTAATLLASNSSLTINNYTFSFTTANTIQDVIDTINLKTADTGVIASFDAVADTMTLTQTGTGSAKQIVLANLSGEFTGAGTQLTLAAGTTSGTNAQAVITGYENDYVANGNVVEFVKGDLKGLKFTVTATDATGYAITVGANGTMSFQIGANANQNLSVALNDVRCAALGISGISISTKTGANAAIETIDSAMNTVSTERSKLGAVQNRLEYTIANLGTAAENLTAAESRIRDVDMALEMANFTKHQILLQSGTAMLAQANQKPQAVLQLLR